MQIFFCGQTSQLCVILTKLIVYGFHNILGSQNTDQFSAVSQNRQRIFGIIFDGFDAVINFFMICYIRIGCTDDGIQFIGFAGNDQIFQIDGTIKSICIIYHVNRGDIIIFTGLRHQFPHGLADTQIFADGYEVCSHHASDLVLIVGEDQTDVMAGICIQQCYDFLFCRCFHLFQNIYRVIRIHEGYDLCSLVDAELRQILCRCFEIGKNLCKSFCTEYRVQFFALLW